MKIRNALGAWAPVIAWMIVIFAFSAQPASGEHSGWLAALLAEFRLPRGQFGDVGLGLVLSGPGSQSRSCGRDQRRGVERPLQDRDVAKTLGQVGGLRIGTTPHAQQHDRQI